MAQTQTQTYKDPLVDIDPDTLRIIIFRSSRELICQRHVIPRSKPSKQSLLRFMSGATMHGHVMDESRQQWVRS